MQHIFLTAKGNKDNNMLDNSQKINITTNNNASTLNTNLFKANAVDISFKGKANAGNKRNLTAQPFVGLVQALNLKGLIYPSVGSISSYTHPTVSGNGNGYNMVEADFVGTSDNYNDFDQNVNTINWGIGFDKDLKNLTTSISGSYDLCFNVPNGTLTELQTYMSNFNCSYVEFGAENPGQVNPTDYVNMVTPWISYLRTNYPNTQIGLDAGLVYKGTQSVIDWNNAIENLNADQARYYMQINDRLDKENIAFTSNQSTNLTALNTYFSTYLTTDLSNFQSQLPHFKMSIGEIEIEDNRNNVQYVNNTPLGCWAIGKMFEWIIKNQANIGSAYWMSLKNLIDKNDVTDYNYATLKQIGTLFVGTKKVQTITFTNLDGVSGVVVNDTSGNYVMLINNNTNKTYYPNVYINSGKTNFNTSYTIQRRYANSLNDTSLGDTQTTTSLSISPYSTSVISFKQN